MAVARAQAEAVIDLHHVAVDAVAAGEGYLARRTGAHFGALGCREVEAVMHREMAVERIAAQTVRAGKPVCAERRADRDRSCRALQVREPVEVIAERDEIGVRETASTGALELDERAP